MNVKAQHPRLRRWLRRLAVALTLILLTAVALDRLFPLPLPDPDKQAATVVLARDGTPLRAFADHDGVWRYPVTPEQVSPLYIQALLGYEDQWFWRHPGVNPLALVRAAWQWVRHGEIVSGGSTLTMQVARIIDPNSRTVTGKLHQILRALQLEVHLSKTQILSLYLDNAPFGGTIEGVEAASWAYLGKPAEHLSHAEAALLAVLPQAPSHMRPDRHPARARKARDKVLQRLVDEGVWSPGTAASARMEPVVARSLDPPMLAPMLARRLHNADPSARRIRSTIDANLQRAMQDRVHSYLSRLPPRTSAALLVLDNATGATRVYVGSGSFGSDARLGYVDMVRAWRSPGSTLKPFLYGMALDDGLIDSGSLLLDAPQSFDGYRPGDFSGAFSGPVTAADALRLSLNVPAVDLLDRVGPARFNARLANAGLSLQLPHGAAPNLSIILGGAGARLEDLVSAYTAFNNHGIASAARMTQDAPVRQRRVLSPGAAWIVRRMLDEHPRPGYSADSLADSNRPPLAWKTGTSYGFRDAWAVASMPRYSIGVWIGRPDGTPMPGQYGAVTALPLLFQVADSLPPNQGRGSPPPASVSRTTVCWPLGRAPDPAQPQLCQRRLQAWVLDGVIPPTLPQRQDTRWNASALELRVDAQTGERLSAACHRRQERSIQIARWPVLAWPWLSSVQRKRASLPRLATGCPDDALEQAQNIHIEGIADGASITHASNSSQAPRLSLRALGSDKDILWLINGRLISTTSPRQAFVHDYDEPGHKTITALGTDGGWAQIRFKVMP